jgi:hypothetical protein
VEELPGYTPADESTVAAPTTKLHEDADAEDLARDFQFLQSSTNPKAIGRIGAYDVLSALGRGGMGVPCSFLHSFFSLPKVGAR